MPGFKVLKQRAAIYQDKALEVIGCLDTPDGRFVNKTGVITEVHETLNIIFIGDITTEQGHFPVIPGVPVADPETAFKLVIGFKLGGVIQGHLDFAVVNPIGKDKELTVVADRHAITKCQAIVGFGCSRERVAID